MKALFGPRSLSKRLALLGLVLAKSIPAWGGVLHTPYDMQRLESAKEYYIDECRYAMRSMGRDRFPYAVVNAYCDCVYSELSKPLGDEYTQAVLVLMDAVGDGGAADRGEKETRRQSEAARKVGERHAQRMKECHGKIDQWERDNPDAASSVRRDADPGLGKKKPDAPSGAARALPAASAPKQRGGIESRALDPRAFVVKPAPGLEPRPEPKPRRNLAPRPKPGAAARPAERP